MDDLTLNSNRVTMHADLRLLGAFLAVTCCVLYFYRHFSKRRHEIILFTRYPVPGKAKTRLIPVLGEVGAAKLQTYMTEHMLKNISKFSALKKSLNVKVMFNGGTQAQMTYWLERMTRCLNLKYQPQQGNDLGDKMKNAVKDSFNAGHHYAIVVGGDIPGISSDVLAEAFTELESPDCDMVLGKAQDGGYYLVGFHKLAASYIDKIFEGMTWGTSQVFEQQSRQAEICGANLKVLKPILQDVDTSEDLPVFEKEVQISCKQLNTDSWSIIVPVKNEEDSVVRTLENIVQKCSNLHSIAEIIVSDGGSTDRTRQYVQQFAESTEVSIKLIDSLPGRGPQQITGVGHSTGNSLMFVHADTILPQGYEQAAKQCLDTPGNVAGAFRFQLDILHDTELKARESLWFRMQMSALVWGGNLRTKLKELPYGDQCLYMSRAAYEAVGGFPNYYLMEDFILVEKLHKLGHVSLAEGEPAVTSARRWKKYGYLRVTGWSQLIILGYRLGVHPNTLARWYYGDKLKTKSS